MFKGDKSTCHDEGRDGVEVSLQAGLPKFGLTYEAPLPVHQRSVGGMMICCTIFRQVNVVTL